MAKKLTKEMLEEMGIRITILPDEEYLIERCHHSKVNPDKWVTIRPVENLTYHVRSQKIKKYYNVGWSYKGKPRTYPLHRVLYAYFFGEVPEGMDVHHIDGCGLNNNLANLEVVTRKENLKDRKGFSNGYLKEFRNEKDSEDN